MGFFDVFRSRKEEPAEEPVHSVPLERLPEWADEQFRHEAEAARKKSEDMQSRMNECFSKARDRFLDIGKTSIEGDDRMSTVANMTKDSYVRHTLSVIQNLKLPHAETYQELAGFRKKALSAMRDMNTLSPKQAVLLRKYFGRESSAFAENLKKIDILAGEIKQFLDSDGKVLDTVSGIRSNAEGMKSLLERSSGFDTSEAEARKDIDRLDHEKKEVSRKLDTLLGSSEWKKMKSLHELIEEGKKEAGGMESEVNGVLRTADRPLRKLAHLTGAGGPSENPFREFVLGSREDELMQMLTDAAKNASGGRIVLKPKEMEKLSHVVEYLRSEAPRIKKRYKLLMESSRDARSRLSQSQMPAEKEAIERKMEDIEKALRAKWSGLDSLIQERKRISAEVQELKQETERVASESGKRLEIKL